MSDDSTSTPSAGGAISLGRLLTLLVPVLAVALAVRYTLPSYEKAAQQQMEQDVLAKLLKQTASAPETKIDFKDEDGDLVADPPADDACITPDKLVFSFVGPEEESDESTTFAELIAALGEATGLEAEYRHYPSIEDQLTAMASGELHVVGLNTGTIPTAVRYAGFQPVSTFARDGGEFGYTMKLLAPADGVSSLEQLAGKRVAFTQPDSNSGFKAALIYLMDKVQLEPERDYSWAFTYGH
ncbi:MAG: PhnD/SsuA/transferrin family substrate-binding protein, partial [Planctomycetota bacterium]